MPFALKMFVGVLDHDDCAVHHHADGDRNPTKAHDVGVEVERVHRGERDQYARRQDEDDYKRAARVHQQQNADERNNEDLFDERVSERIHRAIDEIAAVIADDDSDAGRQSLFEISKFLGHSIDRCPSVLTEAHDDDAADSLAFTVPVGDSASNFGSDADVSNVAEIDRCAVGTGAK